ncbi:acyl-CoA dehydrogenase family protein [Nocardioides ungokensis]|uniref:acyl-CoA dehydrogenase family protein n=1 Tax=Nocardioides ungokensis TaxID=1643322 RepID=UPI001FE3C012|nr:acyl-CoA dehydrogenase family protein [Nocardioides ungokensis]
MDFTYDEEQQALGEAVRGLVGKAYADFENRRRVTAEDPGFDEKLWARLAEMGILGLPFRGEDGGSGAGPVEVGIVAHEMGRVLAPEPYLTSVVLAGGVVAAAAPPSSGPRCSGRSPRVSSCSPSPTPSRAPGGPPPPRR